MVNVLVRHNVSDFRRWKEVFDQSLGMRKAAGELNCRIFHNHMDGSDLTLFFDWESLDMAKRFFDSDSLKKAMQAAGVSGNTEIVILDEFRQLRRTSAD
jgi:3-mercaptopyruvate sulfurtransferase SseA